MGPSALARRWTCSSLCRVSCRICHMCTQCFSIQRTDAFHHPMNIVPACMKFASIVNTPELLLLLGSTSPPTSKAHVQGASSLKDTFVVATAPYFPVLSILSHTPDSAHVVGLHPLAPYLVQLVAAEVAAHLRSLPHLSLLLAALAALLTNPSVQMEPFLHQILPVVITCLVAKRLGVSTHFRCSLPPFWDIYTQEICFIRTAWLCIFHPAMIQSSPYLECRRVERRTTGLCAIRQRDWWPTSARASVTPTTTCSHAYRALC